MAVTREDIPEEYIKIALDENFVVPVPTAPAHLCYLADCSYTRKIVRAGEIRQPGGRHSGHPDESSAVIFSQLRPQQITAWRAELHAHIGSIESGGASRVMRGQDCTDGRVNTNPGPPGTMQWVQNEVLNPQSHTSVAMMTRQLKLCEELQSNSLSTSSCNDVLSDAMVDAVKALPSAPHVFHHLLLLLRNAERSGRWPASSQSRRNVIDRNSKKGESFAMGKMPAHLPQPRANSIFPELYKAAIAVEHLCMPHRPPSSSIVINKHAQFKPHKDSGAGSGQGTSMIVGLGDYVGGELVVEGTVHNIRYTPLEFDGWNQSKLFEKSGCSFALNMLNSYCSLHSQDTGLFRSEVSVSALSGLLRGEQRIWHHQPMMSRRL